MNYNAFLSHTKEESGTEPVTATEVKNYLRLEGFIDDGDSISDSLSDFDYDDDLIDLAIAAVRKMFEKVCGISIRPGTITAVICNGKGMQELKYGPVGDVASLLDEEGDAIDSSLIKTVGNSWKFLKSPCYMNMTVEYEVGWDSLPEDLKLDLLRAAAYYYVNRGDDEKVGPFISQLAGKYKRNSWLA